MIARLQPKRRVQTDFFSFSFLFLFFFFFNRRFGLGVRNMSDVVEYQFNEIVDGVGLVVVEGASKEEGAGGLKQGGPDDMPSAEATSSSQKVT
jgi:hypothetical protein